MLNYCKDINRSLTNTCTGSSSLENSKYEVVVGSFGTVYSGKSCMRASMAFIDYSKSAKDVVVFFENGEIKRHFVGSNGVSALARRHIAGKNTASSSR
jgi:hypothetical protein